MPLHPAQDHMLKDEELPLEAQCLAIGGDAWLWHFVMWITQIGPSTRRSN